MKCVPAVLALVSLAAAAVPPMEPLSQRPPPQELAQQELPQQELPQRDLRQSLLQRYHGGSAPAPRQLTPVERAELRRQLTEYGQPSAQRRQ